MSNSSWKKQLSQVLKATSADQLKLCRLVILGIGNELNGDDAAGVLVVRSLYDVLQTNNNVLLIEGGIAPENFTGPIRSFQPEVVLMVDAADFGGCPGEVRWMNMDEMDGFSASTHTLPPSVLANFLIHEIGCQVYFMGIQAQGIDFGQGVSEAVNSSVNEVVHEIRKMM